MMCGMAKGDFLTFGCLDDKDFGFLRRYFTDASLMAHHKESSASTQLHKGIFPAK